MRAVQVNRFGGPEVLELVDLPDPSPAGELEVMQVHAAGINFADTHATENSYLSEQTLPFVPGSEVIGTLADGRRVCGFAASGGYAELALVHPASCWEVPSQISDAVALSLMVQGLTAWHLLATSARLTPGESVVVHAAAGGVGSIAIQLARHWQAGRVIAAASTQEKRDWACTAGADVAIDSTASNLADLMREANEGKRIDIVLDMVGGPTTEASLAVLAAFGRLVFYGQASREQTTPIVPAALMHRSRSVIGFWLMDAMREPETMIRRPLAELVQLILDGHVTPLPGMAYPLAEAAKAHEDLLGRRTTGKVILVMH
ncbi:MAG: NADPH:quinone oxidoreductase family protein [Candidatus Nanopelagicales bacterium]